MTTSVRIQTIVTALSHIQAAIIITITTTIRVAVNFLILS